MSQKVYIDIGKTPKTLAGKVTLKTFGGTNFEYLSTSGQIILLTLEREPEGLPGYNKCVHRLHGGYYLLGITGAHGVKETISESSVSVFFWAKDEDFEKPLILQLGDSNAFYVRNEWRPEWVGMNGSNGVHNGHNGPVGAPRDAPKGAVNGSSGQNGRSEDSKRTRTGNGRMTIMGHYDHSFWREDGSSKSLLERLDGQNCAINNAHILDVSMVNSYHCQSCKVAINVTSTEMGYRRCMHSLEGSTFISISSFVGGTERQLGLPAVLNGSSVCVFWNGQDSHHRNGSGVYQSTDGPPNGRPILVHLLHGDSFFGHPFWYRRNVASGKTWSEVGMGDPLRPNGPEDATHIHAMLRLETFIPRINADLARSKSYSDGSLSITVRLFSMGPKNGHDGPMNAHYNGHYGRNDHSIETHSGHHSGYIRVENSLNGGLFSLSSVRYGKEVLPLPLNGRPLESISAFVQGRGARNSHSILLIEVMARMDDHVERMHFHREGRSKWVIHPIRMDEDALMKLLDRERKLQRTREEHGPTIGSVAIGVFIGAGLAVVGAYEGIMMQMHPKFSIVMRVIGVFKRMNIGDQNGP